MSYLKISSVGTMEVEALSLIGASTKRGDNSSIGMFGSGLKYSIATMIRQEMEFKIFSSYDEYKITTQPVQFGGKTFNKIYINDKETSLTDSMGTEDWSGAWPFIREIYSNALDEGSAQINIVDEIIPEEGCTLFFIKVNTKVQDIVNNFEKYFVTKSKYLYSDGTGNFIHPTVGYTKVFRKGITVYEYKSKKALFSYDIDGIEINESRVMKYSWKWHETVAKMIEECTDTLILNTFFNGIANANSGYAEHECYLEEYDASLPSNEYKAYIKGGKFYPVEIAFLMEPDDKTGRIALPMKFLKRFVKAVPDCNILGMTTTSSGSSDAMYFPQQNPSPAMLAKVDEAVAFLNTTMYGMRLTYPIKIVKFKGDNILGRFHKSTILLSSKLDSKPVEMIASVIIEEQEHGTTGYKDMTREFQTHLFELLTAAYKETTLLLSLRDALAATQDHNRNLVEELAQTKSSLEYAQRPVWKKVLKIA